MIKRIIKRFGILCCLFFIAVGVLGGWTAYRLLKYWVLRQSINNNLNTGNIIEDQFVTVFKGKSRLINLNAAVMEALGRVEVNGIVKLNNGFFIDVYSKVPQETIDFNTERLSQFRDYLAERGIPLIICLASYQTNKYKESALPRGYEDYTDSNMDRIVKAFSDAGLNIIDCREEFHNMGYDQDDLEYKTDHHWNSMAAFIGAGLIRERLEKALDFKIDEKINNPDNYNFVTYENVFYGSRSNSAGVGFTGYEDFTLIYPKFKTDFTRLTGERGSFMDLFFKEPDNPESINGIGATLRYTDEEKTRIFTNNLADDGKRILFHSDSNGWALFPFVALGFKESQFGYYNYDVIQEDYIEQFNPDAVVILYFPPNLFKKLSRMAGNPVEQSQ